MKLKFGPFLDISPVPVVKKNRHVMYIPKDAVSTNRMSAHNTPMQHIHRTTLDAPPLPVIASYPASSIQFRISEIKTLLITFSHLPCFLVFLFPIVCLCFHTQRRCQTRCPLSQRGDAPEMRKIYMYIHICIYIYIY